MGNNKEDWKKSYSLIVSKNESINKTLKNNPNHDKIKSSLRQVAERSSITSVEPKFSTSPEVIIDSQNRSDSMSVYEKNQYDAIKLWQGEEPSVVSQAVGVVFKPITYLMEKIIPSKAIEGALSGFNGMAQWFCDVDDIKRDGNVNSISELKNKSLELSDTLANEVHNWAIAAATAEGGAAGLFGLPGMIADVPTLITMGLRVIHKIGICYGFECKTEEDKQFVFAIMSAAGSNTMKEKNTAVLLLRQITVKISKETWKQIAANAAVKGIGLDAAIIAIKNLAKQLGINITKRKALQAIPLIGLGVGAAMNAQFITDIAWAARRSFQERWLSENRLIDVECEIVQS